MLKKLKILHTVEQFYPSVGGMQEVVRQISENLVRRGHEVTVATSYREDRNLSDYRGIKIKEFKVKGNLIAGITGEVNKYREFVVNGNYDVVVNFAAQQWATDSLLDDLYKIKAKKIFVPTGFSALGNRRFSGYFRSMHKWLSEYDLNIFHSFTYQDIVFARKKNIRNLAVITNGASAKEFLKPKKTDVRIRFNIPDNARLILNVSSHTGLKGHGESISIFKKTQEDNIYLLIASSEEEGSCYENCLKSANKYNHWAKDKNLNKRILVLKLDRRDTVEFFFSSDLFLFPSNIECSPIVLYEAMAAGLPFLATPAGNSEEISQIVQSGTVLPFYRNYRGLIKANIVKSVQSLEMMLEKQDYFRKKAIEARETWKNHFTWELVSKRYEDKYYQVLGIKRPFAYDVIIPAFNCEKFINDALNSVLKQSVKPKRIIVVNDASEDKTKNRVLSFKSKTKSNITLINLSESKGPSRARNTGIRLAGEKYLAFLDSDDFWHKDKIKYQSRVFKESFFKNLGAVYCDYTDIDKKGEVIKNIKTYKLNEQIRGNVTKFLLSGNRIASSDSGVILKDEVPAACGLFDETLRTCEDWDYWYRISKKYDFDYSTKRLVFIRRHENNLQNSFTDLFRGRIMFLDKLIREGYIDEENLSNWRKDIFNQIQYEICKGKADYKSYFKLFSLLSIEAKRIFLLNPESYYMMMKNLMIFMYFKFKIEKKYHDMESI